MIQLIALIIFILSFGAVAILVVGKIPVLVTMPKNGGTGLRKHKFVQKIEVQIASIAVFFKKQILLHKFLSWLKCRILGIECKVDSMLHNIRKEAQKIDKELSRKK